MNSDNGDPSTLVEISRTELEAIRAEVERITLEARRLKWMVLPMLVSALLIGLTLGFVTGGAVSRAFCTFVGGVNG